MSRGKTQQVTLVALSCLKGYQVQRETNFAIERVDLTLDSSLLSEGSIVTIAFPTPPKTPQERLRGAEGGQRGQNIPFSRVTITRASGQGESLLDLPWKKPLDPNHFPAHLASPGLQPSEIHLAVQCYLRDLMSRSSTNPANPVPLRGIDPRQVAPRSRLRGGARAQGGPAPAQESALSTLGTNPPPKPPPLIVIEEKRFQNDILRGNTSGPAASPALQGKGPPPALIRPRVVIAQITPNEFAEKCARTLEAKRGVCLASKKAVQLAEKAFLQRGGEAPFYAQAYLKFFRGGPPNDAYLPWGAPFVLRRGEQSRAIIQTNAAFFGPSPTLVDVPLPPRSS